MASISGRDVGGTNITVITTGKPGCCLLLANSSLKLASVLLGPVGSPLLSPLEQVISLGAAAGLRSTFCHIVTLQARVILKKTGLSALSLHIKLISDMVMEGDSEISMVAVLNNLTTPTPPPPL